MKRILLFTVMCLFGLFSLNAQEAPQNLVATAEGTSITLTWDSVVGAEYYNIYLGYGCLGCMASPVCIVSVVDYGTYCFTVTAVNEAGESEHSNEACATVEEQAGKTFFTFESGLDGWTTIDADSDGYNWINSSDLMEEGHGYNGSNCVLSQSYDGEAGILYPDNYLVSPEKYLIDNNSKIRFMAAAQDPSWAAEHFGVAVSTASNYNPDDFTTIAEWTMTSGAKGNQKSQTRGFETRAEGTWFQYEVELSQYAGQEVWLAIRHFNSSDQWIICVDNVEIISSDDNSTPEQPDFGTDGTYRFAISNYVDYLESVLVQEDGKIITVGRSRTDGYNWEIYVSRHNADGTLDETYGEGGINFFEVKPNIYINAAKDAVLSEDGLLYIAGYTFDFENNTGFILCLDENGYKFPGFGNNGIVETEYGGYVDYEAIDVDSEGNVVVAGYLNDLLLIRRYTADGELDATFGNNGTVNDMLSGSELSYGYDVEILEDGRIVVVGSKLDDASNFVSKAYISRYNADGSLDATFGNNGVVDINVCELYEQAFGVEVDALGNYLVTGHSELPLINPNSQIPSYESYIARITKDGVIDTSFGEDGDGFVRFEAFEGDGCANNQETSSVVAPDGQIFGTFYSYNHYDYSSCAYVYNLDENGKLKDSFADAGLLPITPSYGDNEIRTTSLALQNDGKLLVGGYIYHNGGSASDIFISRIGDVPSTPKPYRLVSKENYSTTSYFYDDEYANRVSEINNDGTIDYLSYNAQGLLESCSTESDGTFVSEINYVYDADNRLVSYSELVQSWQGMVEVQTEITYNAEGQVEKVVDSYGTVTTFAYNTEGLLIEKAVGYEYDGIVEYDTKELYSYENGKLVKTEYMYYDWYAGDGSFYLAEEIVYEYDWNGNCVSKQAYEVYENNLRSLYQTIEYYYNTTVLNEDIFTFEYPHANSVKPSFVHALTKEVSYYSYFDEATGEVVNHSHTYTTYNYDPEIEAPVIVPAAPQNLVATAEGTSITLTWDSVVGADYYAIYYFEDSTFNYYGSVSNPIGYIHNRVPGVTYCFTVTAINEAGESARSYEACAIVEEQVSVIDIEVEVLSATSARVIATPNEATAEYHYIVINKSISDYIGIDSTMQFLYDDPYTLYEIDDYTWGGMKANTEYYVVARGQNAYGEWGEVTIVEFTTLSLQIPEAPTNLVAEVKSSSEIEIYWDAVDGAEYYYVYLGYELLGYITTPACVVNVVDYGTYCFTVTAVNEVGESELSDMACATIEAPHYWTPDPSLYANNMTVIATIAIDGVEQYTSDLEVGAFCNGELRGAERLQETAGSYECFLMIYGESGDNITFKLYDHASGSVLDLKTNQSLTFEANATIGDVFAPYVINFTNTVVHTQAFTSGWNWYSTYVVNEGADGLTNLENAVGTNGIQIKNQTQFVNQAGGNWYGTLTETSVEDMYMIQMSAASNVTLEGYEVNPSEYPITLGTNWKWISYPLSASISVEEAFASANPSNGDYIKSQTGFAQYYDGLGWTGTLTNMTPGMGYMYQNTSGYEKTFVYPTASSKGAVKSNVTTDNNHWVADYTKYPMNMTMIAVVEGAEQDYEVAAFADGECRGSARPIYIEALNSYILFMIISGEDNEALTFKYYDVETGETFSITDEFTFTVNATVGDVMNPYVMTRGTLGIDELSSSIDIYPNPVDNELFLATEVSVEEIAIYDVYGRQIMRQQVNETMSQQVVDVTNLEAGVYFVNIKTENGNVVKRFVKK